MQAISAHFPQIFPNWPQDIAKAGGISIVPPNWRAIDAYLPRLYRPPIPAPYGVISGGDEPIYMRGYRLPPTAQRYIYMSSQPRGEE